MAVIAMGAAGRLILAGVVWGLCGCGGPGPRSVTNPDPDAKIPAIKDAVRDKNRHVVPQLVKDLDSDDPAVRFYAIRGLRDLTGETFGFRYYEDEEQRRPATARWKQWLAKQQQR